MRTRLNSIGAASNSLGVDPNASLLMAQGVTGGDGDVTTIVTAPDAATLKASVGCLFDPQVWTRLHGRLATLDASTGAIVATDATHFTYRDAKGASLGNKRLVLAGWFSLNPLAFVAMSLLLALALSGTTLWFVRGVGRRPRMRRLALKLAAALLLAGGVARAEDVVATMVPARPVVLDTAVEPLPLATPVLPARRADAAMPLVGTLKNPEAWRLYRSRFVTPTGRVVDTANAMISHSEGQGYGMLLAVAADDRATFDLIWGWTRANLMMRDDELITWRWEPKARPAVADMNDASDGDLLVAWALAEAADAWGVLPYKIAGRRIAVEAGRKLILPHTKDGALLLPGVVGFAAEDRPDGPVVNLSYWVFPAFARLPLVAPDVDWSGLSRNGLELVKQTHFGPAALPTEWVSLHDATPRPADGFPQRFSYNSIRIPLYIAWAGLGQREIYAPFVRAWQKNAQGALPIIETSTGKPTDWLLEKGYGAVAALAVCAASGGSRASVEDHSVRSEENYYAVTLNMLALVAGHMRYPSCFAH